MPVPEVQIVHEPILYAKGRKIFEPVETTTLQPVGIARERLRFVCAAGAEERLRFVWAAGAEERLRLVCAAAAAVKSVRRRIIVAIK